MNSKDFEAGREFRILESKIRAFYGTAQSAMSLQEFRENNGKAIKTAYERYMQLAQEYNIPAEETDKITDIYKRCIGEKTAQAAS